MPTELKLPELGENITAGDVVRILVKPGDGVTKDQPVLELETDKATIEVPSSLTGIVKDVKVKAGEKVKVGQAILVIDEGTNGKSAAPQPRPGPRRSPKEQPERAARGRRGLRTGRSSKGAPTPADEDELQAEEDEEQAARPTPQRARQPRA